MDIPAAELFLGNNKIKDLTTLHRVNEEKARMSRTEGSVTLTAECKYQFSKYKEKKDKTR